MVMTSKEVRIVEIETTAALHKLIAHYDAQGQILRSEGLERAAQRLESRALALRNVRDQFEKVK
jgi:hypothetical protein